MSRRNDITKEQLEYDFFVEALGVYQVAKKHNCSWAPIKRLVKKYGIELDPNIWGVGTSQYVRKLLIDKVVLTPRQISILIGCVLGDGSINLNKSSKSKNAKLQFSQKISCKGYVEEIRNVFQPFVPHPVHTTTTRGWGKRLFVVELEAQNELDNCTISASLRQRFKDNDIPLSNDAVVDNADKLKPKAPDGKWSITDGDKEYLVKKRKDIISIHNRVMFFGAYINTVRHPEFTRFRHMFYPDGKKIVPENIGDYLDELALTVWYEGDGSTNNGNGYSTIATCGFTVPECELLLKVLCEKFSIKGGIIPGSAREGHPILYFGAVARKHLHEIIDPLLHRDFEYKKYKPGPGYARGERNAGAKLTEDDVKEIHRLYATGNYTYTELVQPYGVSKGTIQNVIKKRTWKHI